MYIPYFNALKTKIKTDFNVIKTIDWFNHQYKRYEDVNAVAFPACYIDFGTVDWQDASAGRKVAEVEIQLHLVCFSLENAPVECLHIASGLQSIVQGHALMENDEKISTALTLIRSELATEYDQIKVMILSYKTLLNSVRNVKRYTLQPVVPVVSGQV